MPFSPRLCCCIDRKLARYIFPLLAKPSRPWPPQRPHRRERPVVAKREAPTRAVDTAPVGCPAAGERGAISRLTGRVQMSRRPRCVEEQIGALGGAKSALAPVLQDCVAAESRHVRWGPGMATVGRKDVPATVSTKELSRCVPSALVCHDVPHTAGINPCEGI